MKNRLRIKKLCWLLLLLSGCVDPYMPPEIAMDNNFLVVDGFLNTGQGNTVIKLTRTQKIVESGEAPEESNARVSVEGERGGIYSLEEESSGVYVLPPFNPDITEKYRLVIKTSNGQEYVSDFVPVKQTPPIDSLSWEVDGDGLQIFVNTHDPANNTWYYRWDFEETWEFYSAYYSSIVYDGQTDSLITRKDNINRCWKSEMSSKILVGTSIKLSQDVIYKNPITAIPGKAPKLQSKYSVLVKQYGLTPEAYEYWQNLKKNTENLGTFFDPLPFQIIGNIHSLSNPAEPVLGYFSASSIEEKRIFVSNRQLPDWEIYTGYEFCQTEGDTLLVDDAMNNRKNYLFISPIWSPSGIIMGYSTAPDDCIDCRLNAATNVKPSFWE